MDLPTQPMTTLMWTVFWLVAKSRTGSDFAQFWTLFQRAANHVITLLRRRPARADNLRPEIIRSSIYLKFVAFVQKTS